MDSDTSDRQIQDVDTDYSHEPIQDNSPTSSHKTNSDVIPKFSSDFRWDTLQLILYGVILIVIAVTVVAIGGVSYKKIASNIQTHKDTTPQPVEEIETNDIQLYQLQATIPSTWNWTQIEDNWAHLTINSEKYIDVLFFESQAYLTEPLFEDVQKLVTNYCGRSSTPLENVTCVTHFSILDKYKHNPELEIFKGTVDIHSNTSQGDKEYSNEVFLIRHPFVKNGSLVVISPSENINTYLEEFILALRTE